MNRARAFWQRIETIHAVTYFAPESIQAAKAAGLKGFWMGYFGFRAAPLGAVPPGVVEAVFANFAPAMVERAVPDVWHLASPDLLLARRASSAAVALRELAPEVDAVAESVLVELRHLVVGGTVMGRPLYAANRAIASFEDPVQELWQLCTTIREQRGDGHVLALAAHQIDGIQAHHLLAAETGVDPETFFASRGWTKEERDAGRERLVERGLLTVDGALTGHGVAVRNGVEHLTDELAIVASRTMVERLDPLARIIATSGVLPFPNPMGLPPLDAQV